MLFTGLVEGRDAVRWRARDPGSGTRSTGTGFKFDVAVALDDAGCPTFAVTCGDTMVEATFDVGCTFDKFCTVSHNSRPVMGYLFHMLETR